MMAQANRRPVTPPRRVQADDCSLTGGPALPGEFRPLAPTPAASTSGNGPTLPEAELVRQLVLHYRWVVISPGQLQRYNPFRRELAVIDGGRTDA
jgi:hypothetical protein